MMSRVAPRSKLRDLIATRRTWLVLGSVVLAVVGVVSMLPRSPDRRSVPRREQGSGNGHERAPVGKPGRVLWGSGFEDGDVGVFKTVHRDGSGLRGSHEITTDVARTGTHSLKIVLPAPTSTPAVDDVGRYQLVANMPDGQPGQDRWYGFSIYLGLDWNLGEIVDRSRAYFLGGIGFRYTGSRLNGPGSNLGAFRLAGAPEFSTGTNLTGAVGAFDYGRHDLGPVVKGRWIDFVFHVRWSTGSDGLREEWRNGVEMGSYRGPTLGVDSPFEYRIGIYEGVDVDQTRTLYVDNVRVGTSYAAVDPSR